MTGKSRIPVEGYWIGLAPGLLVDPTQRRGSWCANMVAGLRFALLLTCREWMPEYLDIYRDAGLDLAANDDRGARRPVAMATKLVRTIGNESLGRGAPIALDEGTGIGIPNAFDGRGSKVPKGPAGE